MSTRTKFIHIEFNLPPLYNIEDYTGNTNIILNNLCQFGFFLIPSQVNYVKALQWIESSFPFQFLNKFDLNHKQ